MSWMLLELEQFAQFLDTKHSLLPPEESTREEILLTLMKEHLFLIAEKDGGGRTGLFAGIVVPHILNPSVRVLYELIWWVSLEHRGSSAGLRLLDAALDWAKGKVDWVFWTTQHNTPVADRVFLKRGFKVQQTDFLLEL